jgi:hypothetical protein
MQRSANRGKKHAFLIENEDDDEYEDDFGGLRPGAMR